MKIRTPKYYKDFRCIAGACTDTCCAGWDVDVDENSYKYYKSVKGSFGKRLKDVMVESEGGGCTFTLNNGRCPFLNSKNLCDLYIELGEGKLCDTCDEFPRFINEYGNLKEIGIAPSCKTAGELIFSYKDKDYFDLEETKEVPSTYNDIDPQLFFMLMTARECAYSIIMLENITINDKCKLLLEMSKRIQKKMDEDRDDLISNVVNRFADDDYCMNILAKKFEKNNVEEIILSFFDSFKGMEVINPDWIKYVDTVRNFFDTIKSGNNNLNWNKLVKEFDVYYKERNSEYEQLLMYYVFRYFLDAVNDINLLLKVKIGVIGYIVLKTLDVAVWYKNGKQLSFKEQVDIAHLYSRQFEHSYYNYEVYVSMFERKRRYSFNSLMRILADL